MVATDDLKISMVEVGSDLVCSSKSRLVSGVSVHDASTVALRTFNSIQPVCDLKVKDVRLTTFVSLIGTKIWLAKAADGGLVRTQQEVECAPRQV